jgi:hypothetical protein
MNTTLVTTDGAEYKHNVHGDFYEILGITCDATSTAIRKAYQRLSMLYHPDRTSKDGAEFQKIKLAYETLIDPSRRRFYDATGMDWVDDSEIKNRARSAALHRLSQVCSELITNPQVQENKKWTSDPVKMAESIFNNDLQGLESTQKTIKRHLIDYQKLISRFSKKTCNFKSSVLAHELTNVVSDLERQLCLSELNTRIVENAVLYIKEYKYETDEIPVEPKKSELRFDISYYHTFPQQKE